MPVVELLYGLCVFWLSLYGLNTLILTAIYLVHRHDAVPEPPPPVGWPIVTVQLPIYNELHTVERLLTTVAGLDYPCDRLEIQVVDDSTDNTRELADLVVERIRQQGIDIAHIVCGRTERALRRGRWQRA
jgi:cellulose synthase/poly-beta-1,6-N-acetylglucosamine synthase-like glycosyltransferase